VLDRVGRERTAAVVIGERGVRGEAA